MNHTLDFLSTCCVTIRKQSLWHSSVQVMPYSCSFTDDKRPALKARRWGWYIAVFFFFWTLTKTIISCYMDCEALPPAPYSRLTEVYDNYHTTITVIVGLWQCSPPINQWGQCGHTLNNFVQVRDNLSLLLYIHVYITLWISK